MLRVVKSLLVVGYVAGILNPLAKVLALDAPLAASNLIITEVKVRNGYNAATTTGYDEYIELYNPTQEPVALGNFVLEYTNASDAVDRKPISQKLLPAGQSLVLEKPTIIPPRIPNSIPSPFANLTDGGGWLRLLDLEGNIVDEIGWTSSPGLATASDIFPVVLLCTESNCKDKSITKQQDQVLSAYPATHASWVRDTPTPQSSALLDIPETNQDPGSEEPDDSPQHSVEPPLTCEGITISELLPNAAGNDTGKEFIELHNPTDEVISLAGCALQVGGSSKTFAFAQMDLQPDEYRAFYDNQTGLILPNSAGGKVWLLSPNDNDELQELQEINYPAALDDDVAWALVDGLWQLTYAPSPAAANIYMPLKPCDVGQERNVETGRCQNIAVAAATTLTPCKVGQERNPETGRCRNIGAATTVLAACKAGQERNPETNRCRTIAADDTLGDCPAGQERNPDTNRCRKLTGGQTLAAVSDVPSTGTQPKPKLILIMSAALLAIGYAFYEWRADIRNWLDAIRSKFSR